jgi:hypothetical protein
MKQIKIREKAEHTTEREKQASRSVSSEIRVTG